MQIVIDIPEAAHIACCAVKDIENDGDIFNYIISKAIADGVVLPDNPTNGDMIKAMFPNEDFHVGKERGDRNVVYKGYYTFCKLDWWNLPYKRGTKDE